MNDDHQWFSNDLWGTMRDPNTIAGAWKPRPRPPGDLLSSIRIPRSVEEGEELIIRRTPTGEIHVYLNDGETLTLLDSQPRLG